MKASNLDAIQPISNYVLVKPDPGNDKITLKNGTELWLDTSYEKTKHAVTTGVVIKAPEQLIYTKEHGPKSLEYITDNELKPGDKIIYHYLQALENIENGRAIEVDGEVYFLIRYSDIFCALRDPLTSELTGEPVDTGWKLVVPINGYVFVEADPIPPLSTTLDLVMPDMMKNKKSETTGVVRYIGSPLRGYTDYPDWGADKDELRVGQRVLFSKFDSIPLQYSLHQTIDKDKTIYRMHRRDIYGIFETPSYAYAKLRLEKFAEAMEKREKELVPHDGNVI